MSMKKSLYMVMAMSAMMGMGGMPTFQEPKRYSPPRKLSPEEEAVEMEKRKAKLLTDLEQHNADRKKNFPKFKEFVVFDLIIVAHSQKNAYRDMKSLMRYNGLSVEE